MHAQISLVFRLNYCPKMVLWSICHLRNDIDFVSDAVLVIGLDFESSSFFPKNLVLTFKYIMHILKKSAI